MNVTTLAAHPNPYCEHVKIRWARKGFARAACSRRVALVDDANASAGLLALVLQLRFEHAPAGGERKLVIARRGLKSAQIADENDLIAIDNFPRILVQGVLSAPHRRTLQPLGLAFMAATPSLSD